MPGLHESQLALPWGGTGIPIWFQDDPQVMNATGLAGAINRTIMEGVLAMQRDFEENVRPLPVEEQARILAERARSVQADMPPRENPLLHRTIDSAIARGNTAVSQIVLFGNCAYKQTGLLQASAAKHLVQRAPLSTGFASPCSAFGHEALLGTLQSYGLTSVKRLL
jgi:hypothetical protein